MTWTQAICATCYSDRYPGRIPYRVKEPDREVCCDCGEETQEGIYVRADPATVKYPRLGL